MFLLQAGLDRRGEANADRQPCRHREGEQRLLSTDKVSRDVKVGDTNPLLPSTYSTVKAQCRTNIDTLLGHLYKNWLVIFNNPTTLVLSDFPEIMQ